MSDVQKKADKLHRKNLLVQSAFALPASEVVIQDYQCSLHLKLFPTLGRLYVLPNYLVFLGSLERKVCEIVSYRRVVGVEPARYGLLPNAIKIFFDDGKVFFFSGFGHRNETFYLVHHLFSFPASFTTKTKKKKVTKLTPDEIAAAEELEKRLLLGSNSNKAASTSSTSATTTTTASTTTKQQLVEVDVKTSAEARTLVQQIRELAADTLTELNNQAKIIDDMAGDIDHIDGAAKRGAAHLKAVQSVFDAATTSSSDATTGDEEQRKAAARAAERERALERVGCVCARVRVCKHVCSTCSL
jgi:hypothetical protein